MGISEITDFYDGKNVFVTGATGFVGKATVEKLLRSCPGLRAVYILVRPKRDKDIQNRLLQLFSSSVFDVIRTQNPEALSKVIPVPGDVSQPNLQLSLEDEKILCENVSIIIHSAATVRFDENLKESVNINVRGTQHLVNLARRMEKLKAFVHVSTAYSNCEHAEIKETVYSASMDPQKLLETMEWMDDNMANAVTPIFIGPKPNTYTFTKALAESLLLETCSDLPICIVRPSIVTSALREPTPGWIDNYNGVSGVLVAGSKGILRAMVCHPNKVADLIPVDLVVNCIIATAWKTAKDKSNYIKVYHCCTGGVNPFVWGDLLNIVRKCVRKTPSIETYWYPDFTYTRSPRWNAVLDYILHCAPAYLIDSYLRVSNSKPRMVRLYKKLRKYTTVIQHFTTSEWVFAFDNVSNLQSAMDSTDKELFPLDVQKIHWNDYVENYWNGLRTYVIKETPATVPIARRKLRMKLIIHRVTQLIFACLIITALYPLFAPLVTYLSRRQVRHAEIVDPHAQLNLKQLELNNVTDLGNLTSTWGVPGIGHLSSQCNP